MKNILLTFCAFALSFVATAELDTLITFSTKGPDKYADGTAVMPGECYALVWTKTGYPFAGLSADGTCIDSVNNKLVIAAPIAKQNDKGEGYCPPVMYVIKAESAGKYAGGEYGIYLLDTRKITGSDAEGKPVYRPAGVNSKGQPTVVNGFEAVQNSVKSNDGELATTSASASVEVAQVAPPPADAPKPQIKAIKVVGGNVHLTVANTVPYLQYNVAVGDTPNTEAGNQAAPKNGNADEDITLIVPKQGDKGFFKVQRN